MPIPEQCPRLPRGVGLGWRPETASLIERRAECIVLAEVIAESLPATGALPPTLERLVDGPRPVVVHGTSLSLGSAERPDPGALERLSFCAERLRAPFVSEHVAFARSPGHEVDHLLPVPRTRDALELLIENVNEAAATLPVPLVLENVAHLLQWPDAQMDEGAFVAELLAHSDVGLLLDVSALWANAHNFGVDPRAFLDALPLDRIAYVHLAGGAVRRGFYHHTRAHPVPEGPWSLLAALLERTGPLPVVLERADGFGPEAELEGELDALEALLGSESIGDVA